MMIEKVTKETKHYTIDSAETKVHLIIGGDQSHDLSSLFNSETPTLNKMLQSNATDNGYHNPLRTFLVVTLYIERHRDHILGPEL